MHVKESLVSLNTTVRLFLVYSLIVLDCSSEHLPEGQDRQLVRSRVRMTMSFDNTVKPDLDVSLIEINLNWFSYSLTCYLWLVNLKQEDTSKSGLTVIQIRHPWVTNLKCTNLIGRENPRYWLVNIHFDWTILFLFSFFFIQRRSSVATDQKP